MSEPSLALCGAGMIAGVHAMAAQALGFPVVAVASRTATRSQQRAAELRSRAVTYDQLPSGSDIVIVATPPSQHFDHTIHALERGAAVIVEKPFVATLNEADRLVMIADRYDNRLVYAENLIFAPAVQTFLNTIPECGPLDHISLRTVQSAPTWGDFLQPAWGGGVLFDLGVHPLALAVLIGRKCRAGEIVAVRAHLGGAEVDTDARVTLTYANGSTASVHASWDGGDVANWDVQVASNSAVLRLEILPEMSLERNGEPVALPDVSGPHRFIEQLGYVNQLRLAAAAFAHAMPPASDARFGRWLIEIVCAAYVSASRGSEEVAVPSGCDRTMTPWQLWKAG